jgi:hypothetical protein
MGKDWQQALSREFEKEYFKKVLYKLLTVDPDFFKFRN